MHIKTGLSFVGIVAWCAMAGCTGDDSNEQAIAQMQQQMAQQQAVIAQQQALAKQQQEALDRMAAAEAAQTQADQLASGADTQSQGSLSPASAPLSAANIVEPAPEETSEPVAYAKGPLVDVYILDNVPDLPIDNSGNKDVELLVFTEIPNSESAGTMIGQPPLGSYNSFLQDETLAMFRNEIVGVNTHGFLNLPAAGKHLFSIELKSENHIHPLKGRQFPHCSMSFSLGNRELSQILVGSPHYGDSFSIRNPDKKAVKESPNGYLAAYDRSWRKYANIFNGTWVEVATVNVPEPGVYSVSVWTVCAGVNEEKISTQFRIRTPNDRALRPVTVDEFLHAE